MTKLKRKESDAAKQLWSNRISLSKACGMLKSTKNTHASPWLSEELCTHRLLWDRVMILIKTPATCWTCRRSGTSVPSNWVGSQSRFFAPACLSLSSSWLAILGQTMKKDLLMDIRFSIVLSSFCKQMQSSCARMTTIQLGGSIRVPFRWPSSNYTSS